MPANLIDAYLLTIYPLVLGTGRRLFAGGTPAALRQVDSSTTRTGVLVASYEPVRQPATEPRPGPEEESA